LNTCPKENRPTYFVREVNYTEYQELTHGLSEALKDQDLVLDTDHIQVTGRIQPIATCNDIYKSLAGLGYVYEGTKLSNGCQFGLSDPNFCKIEALKMPFVTKEICTWKLRLKFSSDGRIIIMPLTFPVLDFTHSICNKDLKTSFCERFGALFEESTDTKKLLCCFCVIYNLSEVLLFSFFKSWQKALEDKGLKFVLGGAVYEDSKNIFGDTELEKRLLAEIQKSLAGEQEN